MMQSLRTAGRLVTRRSFVAPAKNARMLHTIDWDALRAKTLFESQKEDYNNAEATLRKMASTVASAPKSVAPIDWTVWESKIEDKDALAALKAEYAKIDEFVVKNDHSAVIKAGEEDIAEAAAAKDALAARARELAASISTLESERNNIDELTIDEIYDKYPEIEQQMADEFEEAKLWPSDEEERVLDIDFEEMLAKIKAGENYFDLPNVPESIKAEYAAKHA